MGPPACELLLSRDSNFICGVWTMSTSSSLPGPGETHVQQRMSLKKRISITLWSPGRWQACVGLGLKAPSPRPTLPVWVPLNRQLSAGSPGAKPPVALVSRRACSGATCKGAQSLVRRGPSSKSTSERAIAAHRWRGREREAGHH